MTSEVAGSVFGKTWRWTQKLILLEYDGFPSTPFHSSPSLVYYAGTSH